MFGAAGIEGSAGAHEMSGDATVDNRQLDGIVGIEEMTAGAAGEV